MNFLSARVLLIVLGSVVLATRRAASSFMNLLLGLLLKAGKPKLLLDSMFQVMVASFCLAVREALAMVYLVFLLPHPHD